METLSRDVIGGAVSIADFAPETPSTGEQINGAASCLATWYKMYRKQLTDFHRLETQVYRQHWIKAFCSWQRGNIAELS